MDQIREITLTLIPFILSLSVHECAHALVADRLGDPTPREQGRVTLNPIAHIDLWGTILFPVASILMTGVSLFAWAKPVQTRPDKFRRGIRMRVGSALVAVAGPLSNVALAFVSVATLAVLIRTGSSALHHTTEEGDIVPSALRVLLVVMFKINIALAVFNLLPIPPLDGHYLLPPAFDRFIRPMARYGFGIVMLLFVFIPRAGHYLIRVPSDALSQVMLRIVTL